MRELKAKTFLEDAGQPEVRPFRKYCCPVMQNGHFRLTRVAPKRPCLSSLVIGDTGKKTEWERENSAL